MNLKQEFRTAILSRGNTLSTFEAYWPHVQSFIAHVRSTRGKTIDRKSVSLDDVYQWRDHLASTLHLAPKSVNQAVSAVKFLFAYVIGKPLEVPESRPLRLREPKRQRRRMVTKQDISAIFKAMTPADRIVAKLQYASLLRLDDVLSIRIKDLQFDNEQIQIADTKHNHFRFVPFPKSIHDEVRQQILRMESLHRHEPKNNPNGVPVDFAFARKCSSAPLDFSWFWLFASRSLSTDPKDGKQKRWHRDPDNYRRRFREAVRRAGILRRITPHDMRRSAATHLHLSGMPIARLRDLLGHKDISTTEIYIYHDETSVSGSDSPIDLL